ncbi:hypothetical protein [Dolichospermum sp. UHCC 0259]|uniref:hypothetical protein n=1 Tax=Dolichospermum sp. UHCC 0259 TaxID=2590010 RepID=UPI001447E4FA|nr:hypothetical protein [Dolichospermum sp. UHCC 0259]MTJ48900.1 hypothetical protein [Dolichospermum sp. UHCC 0259]
MVVGEGEDSVGVGDGVGGGSPPGGKGIFSILITIIIKPIIRRVGINKNKYLFSLDAKARVNIGSFDHIIEPDRFNCQGTVSAV